VVAGARRTAVALAGVAAVVEIGAVAAWLPAESFRPFSMSTVLTTAALTTALLATARRGRPVTAVLGRAGVALAVAGVAVAVTLARMIGWFQPAPTVDEYAAKLTLTAVAGVLLIAALRRVEPGPRRRVLVLLAPALAVPVAQSALYDATGMQFQLTVTPGLVVTQVVGMVGLPLAALAVAAAVLHAAERYRLRLALTRRDDREQA
jgi:hypothetical protein